MHQPASQRVSGAELKALLDRRLYSEVVEHFVRRTAATPAEVEIQLIECLRYLYLVSAYPSRLSGLFLPVEQSIDEIWHYLILQTREYRELCERRLPGQFFIEHRSLPYDAYGHTPSREVLIEQSLRWLPLYRDTFGPFDEHGSRHWTMVRLLREKMDMSLASIAALEAEESA